MKRIAFVAALFMCLVLAKGQIYSPVSVSGFNIDAIAESAPNSQGETTQSLDWSNHVMYSANFAAGAGLACGGILNSGTIVSGSRTYQLQSFSANNAVYIATGNTATITLTAPSQYSRISLLIFSTEGSSTINVKFNYTNGTQTNFGSFTISDWFFASGAVYSGFGRATRVTSGSSADGCSTDPRFYPLDFSLTCADQQKNLQSIVINTTAGNQGAYVMAVSGLAFTQTNTVTPVVNAPCNGGTGSATASISGSSSPFTYSWNSTPTQNTATATNLPAGNYTCTVTNSSGCVSTTTVTITQPPALTLTLTPANASCGSTNGSISAAAGGGTPSYSYAINGGGFSSSSTFASLGAGTYTVAVKDNNGCQTTATASISASASPSITVNSGTICNASSLTLIPNGATTYTWTPATGLSATSGATVTASPGTTTVYTVTGTMGSCSGSTTSTVTVVGQPTVNVSNASICAGGSTSLTASGASTYTWSPATGLSSGTGSVVTANPSSTTVYTINGTAGSCTATTTATVTVNALPVVSVNSATICAGIQTAMLTATGANSYSWSPGTGLSSTSGASVNANPVGTTTYTVTGTDANNCVNTQTSTVTVNSLPVLSVTSGTICNGSSVTLTANGAASYTWSPAASLSSSTGSNVTASPMSTTNYTVIGVGANGCPNADTTSVYVVNNPSVNVSGAAICAGSATTLTVTGASTYTWSPATGLSSVNGSTVTANPGATQTYTITGSVGTCTASNVATVTVNPLPVVGATSSTICVGQQTATVTANGAATYSWMPSTALNTTNTATVTATPGSTIVYTVTGRDANNCSSTATSTVTVNSLPTITVNSASICAGDSATLSASGVTSYTWSPGTGLNSTSNSSVVAQPGSTTVYTISGTDANTCTTTATSIVSVQNNPIVTASSASICVGQQTATLNAGGASSYTWSPTTGLNTTSGPSVQAGPNTTTTYTVTGSVGTCTGVATSTVTVYSLPTISATSTTICNGQSTTLVASGATTYTWSTMQQNDSITVNPSSTTNYSVAGTDSNSCVNFTVATVNVNPLPNVTATSTVICFGASANLVVNGVASCTWSPGTGLSSTTTTNVTANPSATTNYTITGSDNIGCTNTGTCVVTVMPLPNVTATSVAICKGKSATITAGGAISYLWSLPTGLTNTSASNPTASPTTTTVYTVTGTDLNGCKNSATSTVTVNQPPAVVVSPAVASGCAPFCVTFSNSVQTASSVTYNWSSGNGIASSASQMQACYANAGSYTVALTLTDSIGCVGTGTASVHAYPVPQPDFSWNPQPATILESSVLFYDQSTNAAISGWSWNFGDGDSSHIQDPQHVYGDTGSYVVQLNVISNYGCSATVTHEVYVSPEYFLYIPDAFTPNGDDLNDVFLPKGEGISKYKLMIYDRWGNLIFLSDDLAKGWDGTKGGDQVVQQDVYVWKIELRNFKGEPKHLSGSVNLLR